MVTVNVKAESSQLQMSPAFKALEPPAEVRLALHAGQFAILGGLNEDDLKTIGLSLSKVRELITRSDSLDRHSVETLLSTWDASRSGDTRWLQIIDSMLNVDEGWRYALAASWSLSSPFFDPSHLDSGSVGSRANALLHMAKVDLTVTDVQSLYYSMANEVAEGKVSTFENAAFVASSMAVGGLVGFFTMGSGIGLVSKAADWTASKMREVDGWVLDLSERWLLASALIEQDPARVATVAKQLYAEASDLSRAEPSVAQGKRVRMLLSAYRNLADAVTDQGFTDATTKLPDVVGMRLSDAKAALRAMGVRRTEEVDAYAAAGEQRFALVESKWVVRGQIPRAGTSLDHLTDPVRLAYSRPGERVLDPVVAERLSGNID